MARPHLSLRALRDIERAAARLRKLPAASVRQNAQRAMQVVKSRARAEVRASNKPATKLNAELRNVLRGQDTSQLATMLATAVGGHAAGQLTADVVRYARGGAAGGLLGTVLRRLGPIGTAASWLLGRMKSGGSDINAKTIEDAIDLLEGLGLEVRVPTGGIDGLVDRAGSGIRTTPPREFDQPERPSLPTPAEPVAGGPREQLPMGSFPGGTGIRMEHVESSNVYAIGYDVATKTMRVQYLGNTVSRAAISGKGHRGKRRVRGTLGATVTRDRRGPGATYDYRNVPQSVFDRIRQAGSKGVAIWDNLRIRGTVYGHKYDYELVSAAVVDVVVPEMRELPGGGYGLYGGKRVGRVTYVPRRAVGRGQFRGREIQQGSRKFRSLLPNEGVRGTVRIDSRG